MKLEKWGESLAVRIPAAVVAALGLKEGDEIELQTVGCEKQDVARAPDRAELLRQLRPFRGRLPVDFRFNRDEASAR
jgi:antitoxin MazE